MPVSFNEWKKLDIRIGKITAVENHPNADKLVILKVDFGDGEKQLVAGVKGFYKNEQLKGKKIVVLTNLEPATIRGVKSEGMLLAAVEKEDGIKKVVLLQPEKDVAEGTKIE